ncbi:hypothetical protein, partial [Endozoicomonas acroporae]|uniref:hypothetical protein n=1 Tax=Endozoicomonas acroporae TaxID=1701104 RepID=UPI003D7A6E2C
MKNFYFGQHSIDEGSKLLPAQFASLAAPLQGFVPNLLHLCPEGIDSQSIAGHRKVVHVTLQYTSQPLQLLRHGVMPVLQEIVFDLAQCRSHSLFAGSSDNVEVSTASTSTTDYETGDSVMQSQQFQD